MQGVAAAATACAALRPQTTLKILEMLETINGWVAKYPPVKQSSRFGNKAFRLWWEHLQQQSEALCRGLLMEANQGYWVELQAYLLDSFGNETRIDYGTGHETNFILFLCECC